MSFFAKIQNSIQRFFQGKNGVDILSRDMSVLAMCLTLLDAVLNTYVLYFIGILLFALSIFRACSRNIPKRSAENGSYMLLRNKVIAWFKGKRQASADKSLYHYYKCKKCGQKMRVPRGRGKIEIVCPKCGLRFIKKS